MDELDDLLKDLSMNRASVVSSQVPGTDRASTVNLDELLSKSMAKSVGSKAPINSAENNELAEPDQLASPPSQIKNSTERSKNTVATPEQGRAHQDLDKLVQALPQSVRSSAMPLSPGIKLENVCATCNEPIHDGELSVQAIGQNYHQEHFKCNGCSKNLHGGIFFEKGNNPYCEKCMNDSFLLPKCAYCNENIKGKCINALNKNWHPDHFFCSQCGKLFEPGQGFLERDGKAYCEEDYYSMFAPKCATCDLPVTDEVVSALGKSFHADCFVCGEPGCKVMLSESGSFFEHNGKQYCEIHYHAVRGSLCASCQKPIMGRCLTAIGKRFHYEHFVCAFCKKQLAAGGGSSSQTTFKDRDGKPFCTTCYVKLYG